MQMVQVDLIFCAKVLYQTDVDYEREDYRKDAECVESCEIYAITIFQTEIIPFFEEDILFQ